jgi:hypothetical protein
MKICVANLVPEKDEELLFKNNLLLYKELVSMRCGKLKGVYNNEV